MKMLFAVDKITPDPTQYKKFLAEYVPGGRLYVELDVPNDQVQVEGNSVYSLTEAGMVTVLAKLGKVAKDAEQMFYQLDKGE